MSDTLTLEERGLIADAIAAGKVRRIPMGATVSGTEGPEHAVTEPSQSDLALTLAVALRASPGQTSMTLLNKVRRARYAPGAMVGFQHPHAVTLLRLLAAHGWARLDAKGRWFPTDAMPEIDPVALRSRMASRAGRRAAAMQRRKLL